MSENEDATHIGSLWQINDGYDLGIPCSDKIYNYLGDQDNLGNCETIVQTPHGLMFNDVECQFMSDSVNADPTSHPAA